MEKILLYNLTTFSSNSAEGYNKAKQNQCGARNAALNLLEVASPQAPDGWRQLAELGQSRSQGHRLDPWFELNSELDY